MDPLPVTHREGGVSAAAFDLGGVLIDWDPRHLYRKVFAGDEAAMEEFPATVCTPDWNAQQDAGRPWAEAIASRAREFPEERDHIIAFHERWLETWGRPRCAPTCARSGSSADRPRRGQTVPTYLSLERPPGQVPVPGSAAGRAQPAPSTAGGCHRVPPIDFDHFQVLSFDCYGTLIDWEAGILAGLRGVLDPRCIAAEDDDLLERYARHEAAIEAGDYVRYRQVLAQALGGVCAELGVEPTEEEAAAFGGSVGEWPAFPDSSDALADLARRFRLAAITNCDDDLFAASNRRLGVTFDWVITAQQVGSYKPTLRNFELAFERIGVPRERILHVAQSLFHDHVPAKRLGMTTVWVDRRHERPGSGATPAATAAPDLTVSDMATLARLATPNTNG
jgi:2-haloacid dehalogenase